MTIIYARMRGYDWVSVPSDAVIRELEKLGHSVLWVESLDTLPVKKADFVFSPYESVTLIGDAIAKKLDIPHYAHVEVLPPWRAKENTDFTNYGLTKEDPEVSPERLAQTVPHYKEVGKAWKNADVKSISNHSRVDFHHKLLGKIDNLHIRYPSIDVSSINMAKTMYSPKRIENRALTVSRAVPIKRYDLLIQVMNQVKERVVWSVIGDGPMLDVIQKRMTNPKVSLEFMGAQWGWTRYYEMLKSKLLVYAMGGMPPIEAALLGALPIVIENQPTDDLPEFDKFMEYNFGSKSNNYEPIYFPIYKHDQIEKMAAKIDEEIKKPAGKTLADQGTVEGFMNGDMNVTCAKTNAEQIIERVTNANI